MLRLPNPLHTSYSGVLRAEIRSGQIQCQCPTDRTGQRQHALWCEWVLAVDTIYNLERAQEGQ